MRTAWRRASELARGARLSPLTERGPAMVALHATAHALRRFVQRISEDRVPQRAAALAFYSILSFVPMIAVAFAILRKVLVDLPSQRAAIDFVADRWFPRIGDSDKVLEAVTPLLTGIDFDAVGLFGLAALLPVTFSLVSQVDQALCDVFRAPKPGYSRLMVYGAMVTAAPLGAVLSVRYVPHFDRIPLADRHLWPLLVTTGVLTLAFRYLPTSAVRMRYAFAGAATSALILEASKLGFSLYASHLAGGVHLVWGAIAFLPLLLLWVLLTWLIVLLGAEIAAVAEELTRARDRNVRIRQQVGRRVRTRLQRRLARRAHEPALSTAGPPSSAPTARGTQTTD